MYEDIAVKSPSDMTGETLIWKRPGLTACPSDEADITWHGQWQGRVGDRLIQYHLMESDYVNVVLVSKESGSPELTLDVGQTNPTMTVESVITAQLTLTEWNCPAPDDPTDAGCANRAWQPVTSRHPGLAGQSPPECSCANDDGIPLAMLARDIVADFTIDLKADSLTSTLAGEPRCICSL